MMLSEKPEAIVITFPVRFLMDLGLGVRDDLPVKSSFDQLIRFGYRELCRQIDSMIADPDREIWYHSMNNKPEHEVHYAYITVLGKICWRADVIEFQEAHEKQFQDGRKKYAKNWLVLANFLQAPTEIAFKGCQGFRYSKKLF